MMSAMAKEIEAERHYLHNEQIKTIYFGGGTPSILEISELRFLISDLKKFYLIDDEAEITLEANPDDITEEKLQAWKELGINRLSIGIQSFFDEELKWMNRAHNAQQAINNLQLATEVFDNITIDLIYGSPLLTDKMWKNNVDTAIRLGIPHLSCYALTVEEKTPLHKNIILHKTTDVDNEKQARQFLLLMQWLKDAGYEHYEVSNFARPGYRSRHNSSYWKGEKYLGLGPSAHSYNGRQRQWNVANNHLYISGITSGTPKREVETLTETQKLNEYIMTSLRTKEGLHLSVIENMWGKEKKNFIEKQLSRFESQQLLQINNSVAQLTNEGMLRADGIAADLFS